MKPNRKTSHMMSTAFVHHQKPTVRCMSVLSPFLRHLNPGTLAIVMFVALALLSTSRGKETETGGSPLTEVTKTQKARSSAAEIQAYEFIAKDFGNKGAPNR
jgi:hypothetical protein